MLIRFVCISRDIVKLPFLFSYRKDELEEKMLMNLHKSKWTKGLEVSKYEEHDKKNTETIQVSLVIFIGFSNHILQKMAELAEAYNERVAQEEFKTPEEVAVDNVGKVGLLARYSSLSHPIITEGGPQEAIGGLCHGSCNA